MFIYEGNVGPVWIFTANRLDVLIIEIRGILMSTKTRFPQFTLKSQSEYFDVRTIGIHYREQSNHSVGKIQPAPRQYTMSV